MKKWAIFTLMFIVLFITANILYAWTTQTENFPITITSGLTTASGSVTITGVNGTIKRISVELPDYSNGSPSTTLMLFNNGDTTPSFISSTMSENTSGTSGNSLIPDCPIVSPCVASLTVSTTTNSTTGYIRFYVKE